MKKLLLTLLISIALLYCKAQIGLGITTPHPNAYFQINSTNKGVLLPRMTALQRLAIAPTATANGLMVFDTDSTAFMFWTGTVWKKIGGDDGNWIRNGNNIYNGNTKNVGIGTSIPLARLHVKDSSVIFSQANTNFAGSPNMEGRGLRLMWWPNKGAFRAGAVDDGPVTGLPIGTFAGKDKLWDKDSIGDFSFAGGYNVKAGGKYDVVIGANSTTGVNTGFGPSYTEKSIIVGYDSYVQTDDSYSVGRSNFLNGQNSIALGRNNSSGGSSSLLAGFNNRQTGSISYVVGDNNQQAGTCCSWFFGNNNSTSSRYTFAFGNNNTINGDTGIHIGANNVTNMPLGLSQSSILIGLSNSVYPNRSIALGYNNACFGDNAIAIGNYSSANGTNSFAAGVDARANGIGSIAIGTGVNTITDGAAVFGTFNKGGLGKIFEIGNGTDNGSRSSALTLLQNGNLGVGTETPTGKLHVAGDLIFTNNNEGAGRILTDVNGFGKAVWIDPIWKRTFGGFVGSGTYLEQFNANDTLCFGNTIYRGAKVNISGTLSLVDGTQGPGKVLTSDINGLASWQNLATSNWAANGNDIYNNNSGNVGIGVNDPVYRLDVNGRMRIRSGGNFLNSAGIWLNNYANNVSPAFVGMESDDAVGFYGNTTPNGWGVVMKIGTGNVGIGTSIPSQKLHVMGNILATGTITPSDIRYKKDIQLIESPLQKLSLIRGVNYTMNTKAFPEWKFDSTLQYGLIAQEVEKVFPEMVKPISENGYKGVDYVKLIPVLVEGIKELDSKNAVLEKSNAVLVEENQQVKARLKMLEEKVNTLLNGMQTK